MENTMKFMFKLINKLLAKFDLKLISTKEVGLVEKTVNFLNENPKCVSSDEHLRSEYVGDISYVKDKSGTTYFAHIGDYKEQMEDGAKPLWFYENGKERETVSVETLEEKLK